MNTQLAAKERLTVGILGGRGLLGSDLVRFFSKSYKLDVITRENYEKKKGANYKVLINANGNSSRFWANQNPIEDFFASTVSVYQSIFDFPSDLYIYISSSDVYENHSSSEFTKENININPKSLEPYGFHKFLSEIIVKRNCHRFIILRCSMLLGTKLKKGPLYDILYGKPLFIDPNSRIQLITTKAVAEIIQKLLKSHITNQTLNVGGSGTFSFTELPKYFKKEIKFNPQTQKQIYEINVENLKVFYPSLKSSEEYLKDFLKTENPTDS